MSPPFIALLLLLLLLTSIAAAADSPTAYQALQRYGFPSGLLPNAVTDYQLDGATGRFTVRLSQTCSFSVSGYDLKYRNKITGRISAGKITNLDGIQVKVFLFWLNIIEVSMDGDHLEFSVGIASADFPIDNFFESPQCGCGFDCTSSRFTAKDLIPLLQL